MKEQLLKDTKVVIVEDNHFLLTIITKELELRGAEVFTYTNGLEGLAGIREKKPDLILLDIAMPVMNGYEVLQVLHTEKITEKVPVVIISNSGQPVEIERVMQLGVKEYLVKADFEPAEVLEKVYRVLGIEATPQVDDDADESSVPDTVSQKETSKDAIKVMVVEDDPLLRNLLSVKLANEGYPHMFSNDGGSAVELANEYQPDILVLDLMLPGKNGLEILSELRDTDGFKELPVVIFSNKDTDEDKQQAEKLGAAAYCVKASTNLNKFVKKLKEYATDTV